MLFLWRIVCPERRKMKSASPALRRRNRINIAPIPTIFCGEAGPEATIEPPGSLPKINENQLSRLSFVLI